MNVTDIIAYTVTKILPMAKYILTMSYPKVKVGLPQQIIFKLLAVNAILLKVS